MVPSESLCVTPGVRPGTLSPSSAVVRKILFFQTIGDEWPRPAISVFHFILLTSLHSVGRPVSVDTPWPSGPRHCGQFDPLDATALEFRNVKAKTKPTARVAIKRVENFMLEFPGVVCL